MTEIWTRWEGEVIDGAFPLRRLLSGSDHSGVYLTECQAQNLAQAAIKIVPAEPLRIEAQLSHLRRAASLSHPHLIRLLATGRCELGGRPFLFVVMEYAEQTLSQILPRRSLTADEVRELLPPVLDALSFLHRKNLVQGRIKPPNFLVVDDQLKLASDTICPAGSSARAARSSPYDPPEAQNGTVSAAGDIWALGITMIEAFTQSGAAWTDEQPGPAVLPAGVPAAFVGMVRRCLSRDPADRPTAADLAAQIKRPLESPLASIPQPDVPSASRTAAMALEDGVLIEREPLSSGNRRWFVPITAVLLVSLLALWIGLHLFRSNSSPSPPQAAISEPPRVDPPPAEPAPAESASTAPAPAAPAPQIAQTPAPAVASEPPQNPATSVLHQEVPIVSRSARDSIRGRFNITVRVTVNGAGDVVDETLENTGPSKYFARAATAAAGKWKFAPAGDQPARVWLLGFEFTRQGTTAHAVVPPT